MHFTQLSNKHVYPTWVGRYYQYKIYIQELVVMHVYHFHINENGKTVYSSLDHKVYFVEFDETVEFIEKWVKKNLKEKRTVFSED